MTVFPDGTKERLHGHNYYVGVTLQLSDARFEDMVPFASIKRVVSELCASLKEHLLLATNNPFFELIHDDAGELEFRLCGERYVLPRTDVILLPIDNVSVEGLARYLAGRVHEQLQTLLDRDVVTGLEVRVSESPGQGATCVLCPGEEESGGFGDA